MVDMYHSLLCYGSMVWENFLIYNLLLFVIDLMVLSILIVLSTVSRTGQGNEGDHPAGIVDFSFYLLNMKFPIILGFEQGKYLNS